MSATDPSPESKLKHADLEKFVVDTLSKREPCPAMVLAWGWLMKQVRRGVWPARRCCDVLTRARAGAPARSLRGREAARGRAQSLACLGSAAVPTAPLPRTLQGEGGLFHGDSYKQRFFVLARVPHASESARRRGAGSCPPPSVARLTPTLRLFRPPFAAAVLIYYGEKTMDEENILGAQAFARAGTRYGAAAAAATFCPAIPVFRRHARRLHRLAQGAGGARGPEVHCPRRPQAGPDDEAVYARRAARAAVAVRRGVPANGAAPATRVPPRALRHRRLASPRVLARAPAGTSSSW